MTSGRGSSRCDTGGCHRDAVMVHHYTDGSDDAVRHSNSMCLPCYRVLQRAKGVPWGDETEDWHDKEALQELLDGVEE